MAERRGESTEALREGKQRKKKARKEVIGNRREGSKVL